MKKKKKKKKKRNTNKPLGKLQEERIKKEPQWRVPPMPGCKRFQGSLPSPRNPRRKRNGPKDTAGPVASVFLGSLFRSGTTSWRGGGPHCRTSSRRLSFAAKGREKQNAKRAPRSLRSETTGRRPSSLLPPRQLSTFDPLAGIPRLHSALISPPPPSVVPPRFLPTVCSRSRIFSIRRPIIFHWFPFGST